MYSNERCSGRTTINVVQIIAKAMKEGSVLITDHYYNPIKSAKYRNLKHNVIPKILEMIDKMGLEGFSLKSDHVNGVFILVFKNPLEGGIPENSDFDTYNKHMEKLSKEKQNG